MFFKYYIRTTIEGVNNEVIILSCNGMAGSVISLNIREKEYNFIEFAKEKGKFINSILGDASGFPILDDIIIKVVLVL